MNDTWRYLALRLPGKRITRYDCGDQAGYIQGHRAT